MLIYRGFFNVNKGKYYVIFRVIDMEPPCKEIIDDIEDLISSQDITPKERYSHRKDVMIRARKKKVRNKKYTIFVVCKFLYVSELRGYKN